VHLHFQEKPWDLRAAVSYIVIAAILWLSFDVEDSVAIFLVFIVPGYLFVAAFFPRKTGLDWIERIALSFGLSVAIGPLLGLFLGLTPWGARFGPIVMTTTVLSVGGGVLAYWRRMRVPPDQRLALAVDLTVPAWKEYSLLGRGLVVVLAASVVAATGSLTYILVTEQPVEAFTEFYILGPAGNASDYAALNLSQPGTVILGIANHESMSINYTIRIDLVGVQIARNVTSGFNETVEINRTTWSIFPLTLADGRNWTQPYTFRINYAGLWKVQFLLFKNGDFSSAYRQLHFYVRVA